MGTGVGNGSLSAAGWKNGKKPDSNYYAWWEAVPDKPVFISDKKVAAGDILRASVTAHLGGLRGYTLTLTNTSKARHWTFTQEIGPVLVPPYLPESAEVVLESSTHHLAPGLPAIKFSDISVNSKSMNKPDPAVIVQSEHPNYWGYVSRFSNNSFTAYPGK
ncbi:MAG TPA: G1 family glutamic endopeptidase [Gemmatimonadales bacterium]|nr:G1 family glutamic endopeptidase [Gemmatimonadales bacterium]